MKSVDQIIIEPVVTEKTNLLREQHKYTFRVDPRANKLEVMKAIKELFDVNPVKCNVVNVKGKPKKVRYKKGYTASWKKAIITLKSDEKISIFEGV